MSQVSRPVQLALLAVVALGALWFLALRPHSPSGSSTPTAAPAPTPAPSASPHPDASALPGGLGGLARAVDKAQSVVATSSANANQLERNSAAASSSQAPAPTSTGSASTQAQGTSAGHPSTRAHAGGAASSAAGSTTAAASGAHAGTATSHAQSSGTTAHPAPASSPAVTIKTQLAEGKTVALLFWNPVSVDDQAVYAALRDLVTRHGPLVLHVATAAQVPDYGTIVTAVQVLETPTLLLMRGKDIESITDLQDPSDLRQAINDIEAGGAGAVQTPKLTAYSPGTTRVAYVAKVNALCVRASKQAKTVVTPGESSDQELQAVAAANAALVAQIERIPAPAADRTFLRDLWGLELRSVRQLAGYVSAIGAGQLYTAHNLILSAETNDDSASQMALTYGLTDCVAPTGP